jgi:hypothetical protein
MKPGYFRGALASSAALFCWKKDAKSFQTFMASVTSFGAAGTFEKLQAASLLAYSQDAEASDAPPVELAVEADIRARAHPLLRSMSRVWLSARRCTEMSI